MIVLMLQVLREGFGTVLSCHLNQSELLMLLGCQMIVCLEVPYSIFPAVKDGDGRMANNRMHTLQSLELTLAVCS